MRNLITTLSLLLSCIAATAQTADLKTMIAQQRQLIDCLTLPHASHDTLYDARQYGLPAPDSLRLRTADGIDIFAYEVCPPTPRGVIICLSGIHNPSVTAYYGHAAQFYQAGVATIMPDLRAHGRSGGQRIGLAYTETADVRAVTAYIRSQPRYRGVPIIVMGVSMGGAVAIRAMADDPGISGLIALSAFSSVEDFMLASRQALTPGIPADRVAQVTAANVHDIYGVDAHTSSPLYSLSALSGRPVLLMHSRADSQVPYSCFTQLLAQAQRCTHDIDTLTIPGDEHFICPDFAHPESQREYMRVLMRFVRKLTARHPYVRTDEHVELMEVIARLAANSVFTDTLAPRYQHDCDTAFAALAHHPAVEWLRKQLPTYGISYDAIPWMGVHLKWTGQHFEAIPNHDKTYRRWPRRAIRQFLPLVTDFYIKSRFHQFYTAHQAMYQAAADAARIHIGDYIDLDWLDRFFHSSQPADCGIIVGLNNGGGSFSISRQLPGQRPERISVLLYAERPDGTPCYTRDSEEDKILVHEFCHPYIHASERHRQIGQRLLERHRQALQAVGYGTWQNVVEETLVRASVIRYMIDHGYSDEAVTQEIDTAHRFYGFTWLPTNIDWYRGDVLSLFDTLSL